MSKTTIVLADDHKEATAAELVQAVRAVAAGRHYLSPPLSEHAIEAYIQKAQATPLDLYETLTTREREVLHLAAEGYSSTEIATRLGISPRTAETHRANLMRKLGLHTQTDLPSPVLQLVVFVIEGQRYALPLPGVERVLPMVAVSPLPKGPAVALGMINLHGQVIPVVDIRRRLDLPPHDYGVTAHLLVARTVRRILAMPVDKVLGVKEVAAEAITPPDTVLPGIRHVAGIVTLPDGLLFIHDLDAFLSLDEERQLTQALEEVAG